MSTLTKEIREFLDTDYKDTLNIHHHTKMSTIQMDGHIMDAMAHCLSTCKDYLEQSAGMIEEYTEEIMFLKGHSTGWKSKE